MSTKKTTIYVIKDQGAQTFSRVFDTENDLVAKRMFAYTLQNIPLKEDFKLYKVGDLVYDCLEQGDFQTFTQELQFICDGQSTEISNMIDRLIEFKKKTGDNKNKE